ncbi:MAG: PDZ domain-containing protein [Alphaproteobacteria bacterium]|nr:PDZ domain-containing protein [Alphaproteobacteria bacterium]
MTAIALSFLFGAGLFGIGSAVAGGSPYVGMQPQELPPQALAALGLSGMMNGVVAIRDVGRDTPAARAGVQRGDILLTLGGEKIETLAQVIAIVTKASPGDIFDLTVLRNGEKIDLSLTTEEWPEQRQIKKTFIGQIPALGLTTGALASKIRTEFGIRWDSEGVVVTLVDPSKGVSEVIKRGDVIVQFNQQPVWLPEQLIAAYGAAKNAEKKAALVLLERPDGYVFIMLPVR